MEPSRIPLLRTDRYVADHYLRLLSVSHTHTHGRKRIALRRMTMKLYDLTLS